jgi:hypothetical protein
LEGIKGLLEIAEVAALRIKAKISERRRKDLLRGIKQRDPARGELFCDGWIEEQRQAVNRCRIAQRGAQLYLVVANPSIAPEVRRAMRVPWICGRYEPQHARIEVLPVG